MQPPWRTPPSPLARDVCLFRGGRQRAWKDCFCFLHQQLPGDGQRRLELSSSRTGLSGDPSAARVCPGPLALPSAPFCPPLLCPAQPQTSWKCRLSGQKQPLLVIVPVGTLFKVTEQVRSVLGREASLSLLPAPRQAGAPPRRPRNLPKGQASALLWPLSERCPPGLGACRPLEGLLPRWFRSWLDRVPASPGGPPTV